MIKHGVGKIDVICPSLNQAKAQKKKDKKKDDTHKKPSVKK